MQFCFLNYLVFIAVFVQSLSLVRLFATPWTAAHEASLSILLPRNKKKSLSETLGKSKEIQLEIKFITYLTEKQSPKW